ncbi:DEAD/DEAH box helicase [Vibrio parahaemolyticus]|uniref:DEAD/DEAH box helicase n=1 Tax=Vibrio parahaemolyticus TaxID=670 RepID=UPI00111E2DD0|nr:DEAD/DEAH box helicase [Vibrio parahaemolyticus]EIV1705652.1 DEAD/DEAH box helicase [Vibrio parahaemolyticus]EJE4703523.1 DEAD/DEAH box helicase [Vibrio parahaemolyticus]ELI5433333.1 DEAD/DEAH box helicase [Vibrio parahaemolyticus]TOI65624.1 DEAD/DEAH box helicase [Vibrio parahaemolyticus]HCG7635678.1 DEAD/DEAH box helicase [Vibrio parahaemolyticus]
MNKPSSINFTALYSDLSSVTSQAVINRLQLNNTALRTFLREEFKPTFGSGNDFFAQPIFEATFGWQPAQKQYDLDGLQRSGMLAASLVNNLVSPPMPMPENDEEREEYAQKGISADRCFEDIQEDYTWPIGRPPYKHQLEAWSHLTSDNVKSVVVTSGTGSGKTECFLVPLLNDLAKQADQSTDDLVGTQAIFLYPLNALINSQRERLSAWTRGFDGKVKFCLYNGETPESDSKNNKKVKGQDKAPEQLFYRKDIWNAPPPILVTNATMLEYMLVRQKDQPLLEKSQGKLKWIVLDEAHTYVGSQAAEISLLLRRVMHAFGVEPKNVRFVATSATIGDKAKQEETNEKLREFLAKLAGVRTDQVEVVNGNRLIPSIDESISQVKFELEKAKSLSSGQLFDYLTCYPTLRKLREMLAEKPLSLKEVATIVWPEKEVIELLDQQRALELIDLATTAYPDGDEKHEQAFLPVRAHIFHRAQRGLWACSDPECCNKKGTALETGWPFGMVYTQEKLHCEGNCGAPVFELTHCIGCGTPSLSAVKTTGVGSIKYLESREVDLLDDYADEVEGSSEDEDEIPPDTEFEANVQLFSRSLAQGNHHDKLGCTPAFIERSTNRIHNSSQQNTLAVFYNQSERNDGVRCACCNKVEKQPNTTFKRAILGAPFLMGSLVPAMLRHIPSDNPYDMKGKRLITFTDSRQGTARFSAKMQLDSERNWARGWIYRQVLEKKQGVVSLTKEQETAVQTLKDAGLSDELIANTVPSYGALLNPSRLSWDEVREALSDEPTVQLLSGEFLKDLGDEAVEKAQEKLPGEYSIRAEKLGEAKELAHLFLLREFARRAKTANNLESMGLVKLCYPDIDKLISDDLCPEWRQLGFDIQDWKDYLKICLDYYIRENTFVDMEPYQCDWMGAKIMPRLLKPSDYVPTEEFEKKVFRNWPKVNKGNQHRLVRLIELAKGISAKEQDGLVNPVLDFAWRTLTQKLKLLVSHTRIERKTGNEVTGFHLVFNDKVEFAHITKAWICPVTHRWLDTTFRGLSPYTKSDSIRSDVKCINGPFEISIPDIKLYDDETKKELIHWLESDRHISQYKNDGTWSDVSDGVIKGIPLVRACEHSAQQRSSSLQAFEKAFKKDHLNVLSCSTTMEMGVDIGSLSMVAMNNVPPGPANYLQRAGRAGRRKEATALALTFCKATPHGERVFAEPKWPFITPISVPKVSLDSPTIVLRHINAFLLANYLVDILKKSSDMLKMQAAKFFKEEEAKSKAQGFVDWCLSEALDDESVIKGLGSLKFDSAFSGYSTKSLIEKSVYAMEASITSWVSQYEALSNQISCAQSGGDNGAQKKLEHQLRRFEKNYLLSELSATNFLPGYGFPTGVVSLVTNNRSERLNGKDDKDARQSYPSRSLDVALREYAPGAEIVVNGAVYQSQGLQLNWKMPFGENEVKEEQLLRYQWECKYCSNIGIEHHTVDRKSHRCNACGQSNLIWNEFIVPTGFVVDYNKPLNNNYAQPNYVPYKEGKISINDTDWQMLSDASLGRFKISESGSIFHYNDGHGGGYALCWCCGKAEALNVEKKGVNLTQRGSPLIAKNHRRIQGTKVGDSLYCESASNSWSVKQSTISGTDNQIITPFILGYPQTTGMFELQLKHPKTGVWINDEKWMYTLGAALRQLLCSEKGITTQEIGLSIRSRRTEDGEPVISLFMYDLATQGAGFSTSIPELFNTLMGKIIGYLESCTQKCESACHACLLDYDTQHQVKVLDRKYLIGELTNSQFVEKLSLPKDMQFFGRSSQAELLNALQVINRNINIVSGIDFYISDTNWSWSDWPVRLQMLGMLNKQQRVRIMLTENVAQSIDPDLAWEIQKRITSDVEWYVAEFVEGLQHSAYPLMTLAKNNQTIWYATNDKSQVSANSGWGKSKGSCLVKSSDFEPKLTLKEFELEELSRASDLNKGGVTVIENIGNQLDVNVQCFGEEFVDFLFAHVEGLKEQLQGNIERIEYFDKYIVSPISAHLIINVLANVKREAGNFTAEIITSEPKQDLKGRRPYCVADNFFDDGSLPEFINTLGRQLNLEVYSEVCEPHSMPHGRSLLIHLFDGSTIKLIFDQGMGYWTNRREYSRERFDFDDVNYEATQAYSWRFNVKSADHESYIVVQR